MPPSLQEGLLHLSRPHYLLQLFCSKPGVPYFFILLYFRILFTPFPVVVVIPPPSRILHQFYYRVTHPNDIPSYHKTVICIHPNEIQLILPYINSSVYKLLAILKIYTNIINLESLFERTNLSLGFEQLFLQLIC